MQKKKLKEVLFFFLRDERISWIIAERKKNNGETPFDTYTPYLTDYSKSAY